MNLGQGEFSLEYVLKAKSIENKKRLTRLEMFLNQKNSERKILAREI